MRVQRVAKGQNICMCIAACWGPLALATGRKARQHEEAASWRFAVRPYTG